MASFPGASDSAAPPGGFSAQPDATLVVVACGALGLHIREITARRGWQIELLAPLSRLADPRESHDRRHLPAGRGSGREFLGSVANSVIGLHGGEG
jgi:hypothetical protein